MQLFRKTFQLFNKGVCVLRKSVVLGKIHFPVQK